MLLMNQNREQGRRVKGEGILLPMENVVVLTDISGDIQPESKNKVDNDRRPKREKTEINEMKTDLGIVDAKTLSQVGANSEDRSFNKRFEHEWVNLL